MEQKRKVCFLSHNKNTQEYVMNQLTTYLGEYVNIKGVSLEELSENEKINDEIDKFDLYLTTSYNLCEKVFDKKPGEQKLLLADRAFNTENIDKLFDLDSGTKALFVGNTEETATRGINLVRKIGIDYIELTPYSPGNNLDIAPDIITAITTGSPHLIPQNIKKIIGGDNTQIETAD